MQRGRTKEASAARSAGFMSSGPLRSERPGESYNFWRNSACRGNDAGLEIIDALDDFEGAGDAGHTHF